MRGLSVGGSDWVKNVGVYIILILALLRFLIYPLHAAVKDKRAILADQRETFLLKSRLLQQARQAQDAGGVQEDRLQSLSTLYSSETRLAEIQTGMLETLSESAGEKGLSVSGFEMPEPFPGKKISEVSVRLKLMGNGGSFVELLKVIRDHQKTYAVRTMDISQSGHTMTFSITVSAFRMEL
jgi:hypothetical protein